MSGNNDIIATVTSIGLRYPCLLNVDTSIGDVRIQSLKLINFDDVYRRIKSLGSGGYGSVDLYEDRTASQGKLVAIKRIKINAKKTSLIKSSIVEIDALRSLTFNGIKNVSQYYTSFLIDTRTGMEMCIVMEYIQGPTLNSFINKLYNAKRVVDPDFAVRFSIWLFDTIAMIHQEGWVHRDIKPENIIVDEENNVMKLVDFGISCTVDLKDEEACNLKDTSGTLQLRPPERYYKDRQSDWFAEFNPNDPHVLDLFKKADIWIAGITIYYLLHTVFPWTSNDQKIIQQQTLDPNFQIAYRYSVSSPQLIALRDVIDNCLSMNPLDRLDADQLSLKLKLAMLDTLRQREARSPPQPIR